MTEQRKRISRAYMRDVRFGFFMILPALTLMVVLFLYPFVRGVTYSVTNYKMNKPGVYKFVGLANFIKILTKDTEFYSYLGYTLLYAACVVVLSVIIGFGIALLLNRAIPARGLFRALVLLPWVISASVMATNWKWVLNDRYGIVNRVLLSAGIIREPILFFARKTIARITVIGIGTWKLLPFMTVVILSAMQAISPDLYESASIDGASGWQKLRYITIPGIRNVVMMCMMLQFIWNCNNFENIWLLTNGGPYYATMTLPIYSYQNAFSKYNISYGSAISVVMMCVMLLFTIVQKRIERRLDA